MAQPKKIRNGTRVIMIVPAVALAITLFMAFGAGTDEQEWQIVSPVGDQVHASENECASSILGNRQFCVRTD